MFVEFTIPTPGRSATVDITSRLQEEAARAGVREGLCQVFVPHTTAGITINEHDDPDVMADVLAQLDRMVPWEIPYRHTEGNSAAHVKASLMGSSVQVFIREGRLALGTWQGVFLCEFDGPRQRQVWVRLTADQP